MNPNDRTLVIVPTYNEIENIQTLVTSILNQPANADVLIIDDNSPDGTGESVSSVFANETRVHLIRRPSKLGLGTAYTAGFQFALENGYAFAITMDADFSHNPEAIPFLQQESESADLVIGSRYVLGGATQHWGLVRKFISGTANIFAHQFLRLRPRDCTSGFRLYRSDCLKALRFHTIYADGYSYLVEILFRASILKMRIHEIPILFVDRQKGKSKISRKEIYKAIETILRLRFGREIE